MKQCGNCSGDIHLILKVKDWELWLCDRCKKIWQEKDKIMIDRDILFEDFALALQIMGLETGKKSG